MVRQGPRTEAGGVGLDLSDSAAVRDAFERVMANVKRHKPKALIEGVVIQQIVPGGLEMVLGARVDPQFGPLVAVGFGGTLVEILRDTVIRLAPIDLSQAMKILASLRGYPLLQRYRGGPATDLDALAQAITRFSELVADNADLLQEVDVNPLIANGSGSICVDALIVKKS